MAMIAALLFVCICIGGSVALLFSFLDTQPKETTMALTSVPLECDLFDLDTLIPTLLELEPTLEDGEPGSIKVLMDTVESVARSETTHGVSVDTTSVEYILKANDLVGIKAFCQSVKPNSTLSISLYGSKIVQSCTVSEDGGFTLTVPSVYLEHPYFIDFQPPVSGETGSIQLTPIN